MSRKLMRAVCPVDQYVASRWVGWDIESTEVLEHTPGVLVHVAQSRVDRSYPSQARSSGTPKAVYHLTRPVRS